MALAYCCITKMVWSSRSRRMTADHCRGTVYATKIIMMLMITMRLARVNPRWRLPLSVWSAIESHSGCAAANVDDPGGRRLGAGAGRVDRGWIGRIGGSLHFFPIGAPRNRIFR